MKIARILLLACGLLLFVAGLGLLITNEVRARGLIVKRSDLACATANEEYRRLEELGRDYEAAKGTPKEIVLEVRVKNQIEKADGWGRTCSEGRSWARLRFGTFAAATLTGLFLSIAGFFVGRGSRRI